MTVAWNTSALGPLLRIMHGDASLTEFWERVVKRHY